MQREEAQAKIFKLHPLALVPPAKVFPTFGMCLCCSRSGSKKLKRVLEEENAEQDELLVSIALSLNPFLCRIKLLPNMVEEGL